MHIANKVRFDFDTHDFTFHSKFPDGEIREVMSQDEFDDIMNKINVEFADKLHQNALEIQKWFKIVGFGSMVIVGIFFLPVLMSKSSKQSKYLAEFYDDVKEYLYRQNKKKFLKRKIEWKLIKDKKLAKGKDAGNLEAQMHVEIIFESTLARRETQDIHNYTFVTEEPAKRPKKQKLTLYDSSDEDEDVDANAEKAAAALANLTSFETDDAPINSDEEASQEALDQETFGIVEKPEEMIRPKSMFIDGKITEVQTQKVKDPHLEAIKRRERHRHRRHHHRAKKERETVEKDMELDESQPVSANAW